MLPYIDLLRLHILLPRKIFLKVLIATVLLVVFFHVPMMKKTKKTMVKKSSKILQGTIVAVLQSLHLLADFGGRR